MSAHTYYLLFRPGARRAQRSLDIPRESADVVLSSADIRKNIISIINLVWDTGIAVGMQQLPNLIAPDSTIYCTDCGLSTIRHAKNTPVLFVWLKSMDIDFFSRFKSARYALAFFIPSESPFQVADLSFMLLRLQDFHIRDNDYHRFDLLSLCYELGPNGVYGLLLYDECFHPVFRKAVRQMRQNPEKYQSTQFKHPISTWPPESEPSSVATDKNIRKLMVRIR
ncbi:hypothetical protein C8F04DRAFT_1267020 [Mycena alexandri]|uniref:Uncharacterized protein n=1 Tax=Mycena alexandri TaxID=1745969 RepID=A0AAD6SH70_9AGAR|nr:hypothetical protein C8F04DRAFT_1267020 [Mycena alexandri]